MKRVSDARGPLRHSAETRHEAPSPEIERRLVRLLARGAIDQEDADQVRARYHAHPHAEWVQLLDWCEAAQ